MYLRVTPLLPFHLPLYTVRITQPTTTRIHPKDEEDPTFDQRRERSVFSLSDRHARILEADYLGESAIYRVERYGSYLSGRKSRVSTAYQERFFHFYLFLEPPPLLLPAIFYLYLLSSIARLVLIETITEQGGNEQRHFDEKRGSSLDDDEERRSKDLGRLVNFVQVMTEHYELAWKPVRPVNGEGRRRRKQVLDETERGRRRRGGTSSTGSTGEKRLRAFFFFFSIEQVQFEYREPIIHPSIHPADWMDGGGRREEEEKKKRKGREREGKR